MQYHSTSRSITSMQRAVRLIRREDGFSLTELMVVLVIIGILALLALPRFLSVTTRAKATEARSNLSNIYTLQQSFYFEFDRYATTLEELGYFQNPLVTESGLSGGRGGAYYQIAIESADDKQFVATATSVVDFDNDGTFNIWAIDQNRRLMERSPD